MLAGAGDELQGIRKGIMEMADAVVINKADGNNLQKAKEARREYKNALHLFRPSIPDWSAKVTTCSSTQNENIDKVWEIIMEYQNVTVKNDYFNQNRKKQNLQWMHDAIQDELIHKFYHNKNIKKEIENMNQKVENGHTPPYLAAFQLLDLFYKK